LLHINDRFVTVQNKYSKTPPSIPMHFSPLMGSSHVARGIFEQLL